MTASTPAILSRDLPLLLPGPGVYNVMTRNIKKAVTGKSSDDDDTGDADEEDEGEAESSSGSSRKSRRTSS